MLYHTRLTVQWFGAAPGSYSAPHGVRAVSAKHALKKALTVVQRWPGYVDRLAAGIEVDAEAKITTETDNYCGSVR